jgi:hypothetical protein
MAGTSAVTSFARAGIVIPIATGNYRTDQQKKKKDFIDIFHDLEVLN